MRIVVIGATGQTGGLVVDRALAAGDEVVAYTRHPEAVEPRERLEVQEGHVEDAHRLTEVLRGADAVLVAIGPRGLGRTTLQRRTTPHLVEAMKRAGVRRLVVLSAMGVGDSGRVASPPARVLYRTLLRQVYEDKVVAERALLDAGVDVTRVLPVRLTLEEDDPAAEARPLDDVSRLLGLPQVGRATVARVMLDAVRDDATIGQRLVVAPAGSLR